MANPEHLRILKQGVKVWNRWRYKNPSVVPDLKRATLSNRNLTHANFERASLLQAEIREADLTDTTLRYADLRQCLLHSTVLVRTDLSDADLREAWMQYARVDRCNLSGLNVSGAIIDSTQFSNVDLSSVLGLDTVARHPGPSGIDIATLYLSKGKIPETFLRGCGVPEGFITYARSLIINPIDYYSCFISYSSKDSDFADRLHADLQAKAIRCWYAPEDLRIGEKFRTTIEESIRIYDKVMVVLSENSIQSPWVEEEVEAALERERQHSDSLVLFPIRLDDAVMETKQAWAASLRRIRHIGDFSKWKNHDSYQKAFERLLRDLKSQTKPASATK